MLPEKVPDEVVGATALANNAILIAVDPDFKRLAQRFGISRGSDRFAQLNLIWLCCDEVMAAKRLEQAMSLIEHEWSVSGAKRARRLWVDVAPHFLRSNR